MKKTYKNIVSDKIISYDRYIVLAEYETKEEAMENLKADVEKWTAEHKHEAWYKFAYPFAWATIMED